MVTSVGCSFSGSHSCMLATYWDLVTMTTQPPQSVTSLSEIKREGEKAHRAREEQGVGRW